MADTGTWFMDLFWWVVFEYIVQYVYAFGLIMFIFGQKDFAYDLMTQTMAFMLPANVEGWYK